MRLARHQHDDEFVDGTTKLRASRLGPLLRVEHGRGEEILDDLIRGRLHGGNEVAEKLIAILRQHAIAVVEHVASVMLQPEAHVRNGAIA